MDKLKAESEDRSDRQCKLKVPTYLSETFSFEHRVMSAQVRSTGCGTETKVKQQYPVHIFMS